MSLLDSIAEARIQEAVDRGELQGLPGEGKPLRLDDDSQVPAELRAGYRLLKNAGFLPPELADRREIREVESLLRRLDPAQPAHRHAQLRLGLLRARLESRGGRIAAAYERQLLERLER